MRKGPKTSFWPHFGPKWPTYHYCHYISLLSTILRKIVKSQCILTKKMAQNLILAPFGPKWPIFGPTHFFFKNLKTSLFYTYFRLSWCKKSEKTNGRKYENFCYRRTDWQTDRLTDGARLLRTRASPKKKNVPCGATDRDIEYSQLLYNIFQSDNTSPHPPLLSKLLRRRSVRDRHLPKGASIKDVRQKSSFLDPPSPVCSGLTIEFLWK